MDRNTLFQKYFKYLLGMDDFQNNLSSIELIESNKINKARGWLQPLSLICLFNNENIYVSYIKDFSTHFENFKKRQTTKIDILKTINKLSNEHRCYEGTLLFNPQKSIDIKTTSSILKIERNHIELLKDFVNASLESDDLKKLYMEELINDIDNNILFGFKIDDKIVSLITYPDNYFKNTNYKIIEIGIETLNSYRNKGYGLRLGIYVINYLTNNGYTPVCRISKTNPLENKIIKFCSRFEFEENYNFIAIY